jgi:hypothetical protein
MINKKNKALFDTLSKYANEYVKHRASIKKDIEIGDLVAIDKFIMYVTSQEGAKKKKTAYDKCIICRKLDCTCNK